jgi:hypothetical protein
MDTTNLVVGQKVWMRAGTQDLFRETTVVEITDGYTEVEADHIEGERPFRIRFDKDGKQPVWDGRQHFKFGSYELFDFGNGPVWWCDDPRLLCAGPEFEPWELVER